MPGGIPTVKLKRLSGGQGYQVSGVANKLQHMANQMDIQYNVPTSSRFNLLAPKDPTGPQGTLSKPKSPDPEHFIILKEHITQLYNTAELVGLYNWKRLKNGDIKILPANEEAAAKIKVEVMKNGWYTHPTAREYKYVVYGLMPMKPQDLVNRINVAAAGRVTANYASQMTIKNPSYSGQCNYLVYFAQNPTLEVLRESIVHINNAIPSWAHYRNKKPGDRISQCTNCQKAYHGKRGCHLPPACGVCAEPHPTSECPLLVEKRAQNKARIDEALLKCINCGGHHTASYKECEYLQRVKPQIKRSRLWAQNYSTNTPTEPQYIQSPPDLQRDFPALQRPHWQAPSQQHHQQQHQPPQFNVNHGSDNSNLFNIQEIQIIMRDIMTQLRNCKSKEDQFNVMFTLAAKYVYSP